MSTKAEKAATEAVAEKPFSMADFYTLGALEKGKKLPLTLPDGTETEHYLMVMGSDAPAARKALLEASRMLRGEAKEKMSVDAEAELAQRANLHYLSVLAFDWSFPVPYTKEAVTELLLNNPGLSLEVEKLASDRTRFFAKDSPAS